MRIIVNIGHPAHVHLFKNFIWEMEKRGHKTLITATKKDVTLNLLDNYGLDYVVMGTYGGSRLRKAASIPAMDLGMILQAKRFKPDIFVGVAPVRASHAAALLKKPCIALDDTEHSRYEILLYKSFVNVILTPSCFKKDLGKKQLMYHGYHELAYLHPNRFRPDPAILTEAGLSQVQKFVIIRFVSWGAIHDVGQRGFDLQAKRKLVQELEKLGRVLITSESPLPEEFEKYRIKVPPERLHDLLYYATLYIGEGATVASECAILGTPAIYVNTLRVGYLDEQEERYGLVYNFSDPETAQTQGLEKALELLQRKGLKQEWAVKRQKLLSEKIDVTAFMLDFVENYPDSLRKYQQKHEKQK